MTLSLIVKCPNDIGDEGQVHYKAIGSDKGTIPC